ncbi:unnamed protein product [Strongylus vulgaris]|uniref:Uncharacterized protein n=1 Tax=Strongylus vulgaris TaxID=40348 RepID=A0A3P7JUE4_STRVU|nr:unnamed protein product [Strongylus vulgaris]
MAEVEHQWIHENNLYNEFLFDIWLPNIGMRSGNLVYFVFFKYRLEYHSIVEV